MGPNELEELFQKNRAWSARRQEQDPGFFKRLCAQQAPRFLWIGCSDSRVPANEITGLDPGEMFVHRNVANIVVHTDFNCLSVIQYAIEVLKVEHVIVCGHYGCGGVRAALRNEQRGLIDNWLRNIKDVYDRHETEMKALDEVQQVERLVELNVRQQVVNVCHTTIVQNAWKDGRALHIHGWVYGIQDGLLHDMGTTLSSPDQLKSIYQML